MEHFSDSIVFRPDLSWKHEQKQEIFQILSSSIGEIFDSFDFNVFIIDEDGYFRYVNTHYCTIAGRSRDQIVNHHITDVLPKSFIERYYNKEILLNKEAKYADKYKNKLQTFIDPDGNEHLFKTEKSELSPENLFRQIFNIAKNRLFLGTGIDVIDFENSERDLKCVINALNKSKGKLEKNEKVLESMIKALNESKDKLENNEKELKCTIEALNHSKKRYEDGLRAAQCIQQESLPSLEYITECFPDHSLLYYPKHIVSGDFYWMTKIEKEFIAAIGDCTGHGISGAMMSISAIGALNEVVKIKGIHDPVEIVKELDKKMARDFNTKQKTLKREGEINLDNLDISICRIDPIQKKLILSLVNSKAYLWNNNTLIELGRHIKGTGATYHTTEDEDVLSSKGKSHQTYNLSIDEGAILYMFTDGYKDQFGKDIDKKEESKLGKERFRCFLENIIHMPLQLQDTLLKEYIKNWKGDNDQTDDITVFGIKLL